MPHVRFRHHTPAALDAEGLLGDAHTGCSTEASALIERRALAAGFGIAMVAATLRPVLENWRDEPRDGFPLSYYPMFTARRRRTVRVTHLLGIDTQGERHIIPCRYAGTGGLNQVRKHIAATVSWGGADELARSVARRISRGSAGMLETVVKVQVVTGAYDMDRYFRGKRRPKSEEVHAECPVPKRA